MKKILNFLFGNDQQKKNQISSIEIPRNDIKILFLKRIKGMDMNFDFDSLGYKDYLGGSDKIISEFVGNGLIRSSEYLDTLKLPEVKDILKRNELSISGKKADLISRIKENISPDKYLKKDFKNFFVLTEKGLDTISKYETKYRAEIDKFSEEILNLILKGNLNEAKKTVILFNKQRFNPGGFFLDESEKLLTRRSLKVDYFFKAPKFLSSLNLSSEEQKLLGKYFCCYCLFEDFNLSEKIEKEFSHIKPIEVIDFLRNNPYGQFSIKSHDILRDVIEVFINYEYNYADNKARIDEVLKSDFKDRWYGVQVLNGGCEKCKDLEPEIFKFSDLAKITVLPRYPGCVCLYSAYKA